jgi:hypothetical protein
LKIQSQKSSGETCQGTFLIFHPTRSITFGNLSENFSYAARWGEMRRKTISSSLLEGVKSHARNTERGSERSEFIFSIAFFLVESWVPLMLIAAAAAAFHHVIYSMGNFASSSARPRYLVLSHSPPSALHSCASTSFRSIHLISHPSCTHTPAAAAAASTHTESSGEINEKFYSSSSSSAPPFSRCLIGFCAVNETGDVAYTAAQTSEQRRRQQQQAAKDDIPIRDRTLPPCSHAFDNLPPHRSVSLFL